MGGLGCVLGRKIGAAWFLFLEPDNFFSERKWKPGERTLHFLQPSQIAAEKYSTHDFSGCIPHFVVMFRWPMKKPFDFFRPIFLCTGRSLFRWFSFKPRSRRSSVTVLLATLLTKIFTYLTLPHLLLKWPKNSSKNVYNSENVRSGFHFRVT